MNPAKTPFLLLAGCVFMLASGARSSDSTNPDAIENPPQKAGNMTLGTRDFPILKVTGYAQMYLKRGVFQVNGDKTGFDFGAVKTTFKGTSFYYNVTIYTQGDADGRCTYRLFIDSVQQGEDYKQPKSKNGQVIKHTWKKVPIKKGADIMVASNGNDDSKNKPGKGPRGYHMAHGRWSKLELNPVAPLPELEKPEDPPPDSSDTSPDEPDSTKKSPGEPVSIMSGDKVVPYPSVSIHGSVLMVNGTGGIATLRIRDALGRPAVAPLQCGHDGPVHDLTSLSPGRYYYTIEISRTVKFPGEFSVVK